MTARKSLSVSSIGTNELQQRRCCDSQHIFLSFSFLYRNERTATRRAGAPMLEGFTFQFPLSERTNCNKALVAFHQAVFLTFSFLYRNERTATDLRASGSTWKIDFQFPLSERTNCNHRVACVCRTRRGLSVSSIGTNELQRRIGSDCLRKRSPFSFLYRNERTATRDRHHCPTQSPQLSVSSIGTNELQHKNV